MNKQIIEFAEKGVFISAAFDKNCTYHEIPSWIYTISDINNDDNFDSGYGYNSYEESINEALSIAKIILENEKNI